jgi:hypothetical protein
MKKYDIALSDAIGQTGNVRLSDPLEEIRLARTEIARVSDHPMQSIVDSLGDREELGITGHHQPPDVYARVLDVADEDLEHLGHSTPGCRGADVPHRSPLESLSGSDGRKMQVGESLRSDQRLES